MKSKIKIVKLVYPEDNYDLQKQYAKAAVKLLVDILSNDELLFLIEKLKD